MSVYDLNLGCSVWIYFVKMKFRIVFMVMICFVVVCMMVVFVVLMKIGCLFIVSFYGVGIDFDLNICLLKY